MWRKSYENLEREPMIKAWYLIQIMVEHKLAKKAMKELISLPDGVERAWDVFFWGKDFSLSSFIISHPIRFLELLFIVDKYRLIETFEIMAIQEGYIIDVSNFACSIGVTPKPIFRIKENLLNTFSVIHETKMLSNNNTSVYYVKELFEKRNGKEKLLQLYRIPQNSTTGTICIHTKILWITIIVLKGKCTVRRGVVTDDNDRFQLEDEDWELMENEECTLENYFKVVETNEYSCYELLNAETHDLLLLVLPVDDNTI
jgi:hypothetical protein